MLMSQQQAHSAYTIMWNMEQLKQAATNLLLLFKVADNSLTLLRSGFLNSDLLNLYTFKRVIAEGTQVYKDLEFPILNLSRGNIPKIISLIKIQHLMKNKFIMKIPLVQKADYKIYSLIPHPIKLQSGSIMIAEMNELILLTKTQYIIIPSQQGVTSINSSFHIINNMEPLWDITQNSCEYASFVEDVTSVMTLCNFKRLGLHKGIYLTNTPHNRLLYVSNITSITLDCPDTIIKDKVIGLNLIPFECTLTMDQVTWPALLKHEVNIEALLDKTKKGKSFGITYLPPFLVNESHPLHETIKDHIDKLPSEESDFTFDFDKYDLSLEEVTSYSIVAYGTVTVIVIINSILIFLLYLTIVRKWLQGRTELGSNDSESGLRNRIARKLPFSPNDSIKLPSRDSFRRAKTRMNNLSRRSLDSIRSSVKSAAKSTRRHLPHRQTQVPSEVVGHEMIKLPPTVVDIGTNTSNNSQLYPTIYDVITPRSTRKQNITFPAY